MCIIVDTDRIDLLLKEPPGDDTRPILRWLWRGHGSIVYSTGGGFSTEVQKRAKARFREWARAGWARVVPAETPRGRIYSRASNADLLTDSVCRR